MVPALGRKGKKAKVAKAPKPQRTGSSQAAVIDGMLRESTHTLDQIVKRVEAMGGRRGRVLGRLAYLKAVKRVAIRDNSKGTLTVDAAGAAKLAQIKRGATATA